MKRRSRWIAGAMMAWAVTVTGCDDGGGGAEQEAESEEPRAELTNDPPIEIKVLRRSKKMAHRGDSIYTIKPTTAGWRFEEFDLEKSTIDALVTAATQDLIPSDGHKSCKQNKENVAFEITIPQKDGAPLKLISDSDCLNFAPWNVIKDGKLYVQTSGAIGKTLQPIGMQVEHIVWDTWVLPSESRYELTTEPTPVEGGEAQQLPLSTFHEKLVAHPVYEKNFKKLTPQRVRLFCSQRDSADCSTLEGEAELPFRDKVTLVLEFNATTDAITAVKWPESDKPIQTVLESKPFSLAISKLPKATEGSPRAKMRYQSPGTCKYMEAGVSHFNEKANPEKCDQVYVNIDIHEALEKLPPNMYYYPEINAFALTNHMDGTDLDFYKKLKAPSAELKEIDKDIIYDKFHFYATPGGDLVKLRK